MFTISEILQATQGRLICGNVKQRVIGVSTDTRLAGRKQLFVAIKGDKFDGHEFVAAAVNQGVTAVMVCKEIEPIDGVAVIVVEDTVRALGHLARFHRRRFSIPVIAITGSAGKTTTKEFIASILSTKLKTLYSAGTENNHIGVPMTLLKMTKRHQAAVIEAGTNHHGEIAWLGSLIEPTISVFTNIGPAHLEGLGDAEGVYREKSTLANFTSQCLVINSDDPWLRELIHGGFKQRILTYGVDGAAEIKAGHLTISAKDLKFDVDGQGYSLASPVAANVYNALAGIACAQCLGVDYDNIIKGLKRFKTAKGRQVFSRVAGVTVVDDTYNANPLSFKNAIKTLAMLKRFNRGRAILIAADMLELGPTSEDLHREVGLFAADHDIDIIFTLGEKALQIGQAATSRSKNIHVTHFLNYQELASALKKLVRKGDIILAKGSRGMKMERVIEDMIESLKQPRAALEASAVPV